MMLFPSYILAHREEILIAPSYKKTLILAWNRRKIINAFELKYYHKGKYSCISSNTTYILFCYRSMYKIRPPGSMRTNTLGTVTYWNSASLAFGKYTSGFQILFTRLGSFKSNWSISFGCCSLASNQCCLKYKSTW